MPGPGDGRFGAETVDTPLLHRFDELFGRDP
jgi:hypothetical protein